MNRAIRPGVLGGLTSRYRLHHWPCLLSRRTRQSNPDAYRAIARSRLLEEEIYWPAAADMRSGTAAVVENGVVGTAGIFQGVCQLRQPVEVSLIVYHLRQPDQFPSLPIRITFHRA